MKALLNERIEVGWELCVLLAFSIFLIPINWLFSWMIAVCIHELCHYVALRVCGARIYRIKFGLLGAKMDTEALNFFQEILGAAAGPLGSFLLASFVNKYPFLVLCAFIQGVFNLMPIYPMDGGRIVRCLFALIFGSTKGERLALYFAFAFSAVLLALALYIGLKLNFGILPII